MIRVLRLSAGAHGPVAMLAGWNITPNTGWSLALSPSASACAVILVSPEGVPVASGAAILGENQPVVLHPIDNHQIGMLDPDLGWHVLVTTSGQETPTVIDLDPFVDLQDEIHPIYQEDGLALVRGTALIDEHTHYVDAATIQTPLLSRLAPGHMAAAVWDGQTLSGQVESIAFEAKPNGYADVITLHKPIPVVNYVLSVVDDCAETPGHKNIVGNVLANDGPGLSVTAINGNPFLVGEDVPGSAGGVFVINFDGSYSFVPGDDFFNLVGDQVRQTSVVYTASDGAGAASASLTVSVSAPVNYQSLLLSYGPTAYWPMQEPVGPHITDIVSGAQRATTDCTFGQTGVGDRVSISANGGMCAILPDNPAYAGGLASWSMVFSMSIRAGNNVSRPFALCNAAKAFAAGGVLVYLGSNNVRFATKENIVFWLRPELGRMHLYVFQRVWRSGECWVELWQDGIKMNEAKVAYPAQNDSAYANVLGGETSGRFYGNMADVAYFANKSLTPAEIAALHGA